ncbi:hypothetical protein F5Y18DRAFT_392309 [Xylariaceae sp. FL1019]|nr:hypothetical protein F5Y18DRAFT_392309 [Xylariaceae sp. FL1019]
MTPFVMDPTVMTSVTTVTEPATPAAPDKTVTPSVKAPTEPLKIPQKPEATSEGTVKPAIAATVETSLKPTTVATITAALPSPDSLDAGEVLPVDNLKAEDPDIVTLEGPSTAHGQDHLDNAPDALRHPSRPGDTWDDGLDPNAVTLQRFLALLTLMALVGYTTRQSRDT